ncbi:DUF58 domain-containing protein [Luteolibacter sp. LG18]|uniref:DUF58 domain-containing protein n=1 Tax=Luteolibacter sp. LG18 TaxID=2819286 RepID=UPI002B2D9E38|nr:hypothetical protein llg_01290 [Luteolibacter sp. LG18]
MTADDLQKCHSRALATAGRLRLPLRSKVWRGQAGEFNGGGTGSSLDFQDHRSYVPGDDPRHLNWQAYARTGHYTMKLYREEVRPVVDLIFDASESMFFDPVKAARSAELFYFIVETTRANGASVGIHVVRGDASVRVDPDSIPTHRWLEAARKLPATDLAAPLDLSRVALRANAVRVLISDLLFPGNPDPLLRHLGQRHGSTIVFAPFLESEAKPDWAGNYEFVDAERQTRHQHRIEPTVLDRYLAAYARHFSLWKQSCRRHQAAFARVPAEPDLATALFSSAIPVGALETSH